MLERVGEKPILYNLDLWTLKMREIFRILVTDAYQDIPTKLKDRLLYLEPLMIIK